MAKAIMIQGTMSNAGKTFLVAGLCRILKQDGYKVAPFKAQNMALNSFITKDGLEMGRAQVVQAEAAGIEPDVRMNPILLKPTSDQGSQVILHGEVLGNVPASKYFKEKNQLAGEVMKAYDSLSEEYDIIVIEGAGSPAEINLKQNDIVNMGMAKRAKSPVLLVGDIDRGGVFASLAGTMLLLDEDEKALVKGTVINKFRGDVDILKPGLTMLEDIIHRPVLGVVPYMKVAIEDEDSLSTELVNSYKESLIDIVIPKLPRISNFTDFHSLSTVEGVNIRYITKPSELGNPDLIILPGSKNTMEDLTWLREVGVEGAILRYYADGGTLFGICGGYQMLGEWLEDPHGVEKGGKMRGMGLLPTTTIFGQSKTRTRVTGKVASIEGPLKGLAGRGFEGYEIHMGETRCVGENHHLLYIEEILGDKVAKLDGSYKDRVYGTYVHGVFDTEEMSKGLIEALLKAKGMEEIVLETTSYQAFKEEQYDLLADTLRQSLDMERIYHIIEEGV